MKIAVTGGSGFIGAHLVRQLIAAGHRVTVLDPRQPAEAKAHWQPVDVTRPELVTEATRDVQVVYHLAAISDVNEAYVHPLTCVEANIRGTANVLEAARLNRVDRVIFASTVWVYQASPDPEPNEDTCFSLDQVSHLYTASKIAGEMLCHTYQRLYGVPYTVLRYGVPYGPFMRQQLLIPSFIKQVLAGKPLLIHGDGSQFRKFIYVEDLARGNVAALSPEAADQTYNLEGTEKVTVLDVANALDRILDGVSIRFEAARPGDLKGVETGSHRALRDLGWQPSVGFEEGLRRTVTWYLTLGTGQLPTSSSDDGSRVSTRSDPSAPAAPGWVGS